MRLLGNMYLYLQEGSILWNRPSFVLWEKDQCVRGGSSLLLPERTNRQKFLHPKQETFEMIFLSIFHFLSPSLSLTYTLYLFLSYTHTLNLSLSRLSLTHALFKRAHLHTHTHSRLQVLSLSFLSHGEG